MIFLLQYFFTAVTDRTSADIFSIEAINIMCTELKAIQGRHRFKWRTHFFHFQHLINRCFLNEHLWLYFTHQSKSSTGCSCLTKLHFTITHAVIFPQRAYRQTFSSADNVLEQGIWILEFTVQGELTLWRTLEFTQPINAPRFSRVGLWQSSF